MKPDVSVVIDTHNYGHFIQECIDSVLNQDFPMKNVEIIVVDDGSTDDTPVRVKKYEGQIEYIYQKNKGQAGAFNTGFANARGEIICLLDADDFWYPNKIEKVVEAFDKYPDAGLVQHPSDYVDSQGKRIKKTIPELPEFYTIEHFLNNRTSFYGTSNLSFRKKYLENILPEPEEMGNYADQYLYWNILFYSKVHNINIPLAAHRIHGSNWYAKMWNNLEMLEMHINVLEKVNFSVRENIIKFSKQIDTDPPALKEQEKEIVKERVILHRKKGEVLRALKAFLETFKCPLGNYSVFRSITLLLALVSPLIYLKFFTLYSNIQFLPRLRNFVFPAKL